MEVVRGQLPSELVQRLRREVASEEALSQVVAEAIQMWLEQRRTAKTQPEQGLALLRRAGLDVHFINTLPVPATSRHSRASGNPGNARHGTGCPPTRA